MVNHVILIGRLTRDPEPRTTTTGKTVVNFGLAVNKKFKPQDGSADADFFTIIAWNQTADYVANYLKKGRLISVEGRLQTRKYTTKEGQERDVVEVVADSIQGLDRPRDDQDGGGGGGDRASAAPAATGSRSAAPSPDEYDPFADE